MKLDAKIRDRKIAYFFRRDPEIAIELGLLYFVMAKRKESRCNVQVACSKSVKWLKTAGLKLAVDLETLSSSMQMEEIQKILVNNKTAVLP